MADSHSKNRLALADDCKTTSLPSVGARITDGEIETVGNGITQIIVVYQVETVAQEDFFQAAGTFTVYFHFIKKVVLIFISCFKHGGKSILSRVGHTVPLIVRCGS